MASSAETPTVSTAIKRLGPLLSGLQSADDFIQEVVNDALQDFVTRVNASENVSLGRLETHRTRVVHACRLRLHQPVSKSVQCRARTKAKKRCKAKARSGSEFCGRHNNQRDAHMRDVMVRQQLTEHDALARARKASGHNHRWSDDTGLQQGCAVCDKYHPSAAASYSGQSMAFSGDDTEREADSAFVSQ